MKKIAIGFLIFLCVGIAVINTSWFKNKVFDLVTSRIEQATGMHITIGGFNYAFPLTITLNNIALGSPEDPDLTVAEIHLQVSVSALWRNEIKIHNLILDHVILHRAIHFPESSEARPGSFEVLLPFNLANFQINDLVLDPRVPPLHVQGNLAANGPEASGFIQTQMGALTVALDLYYEKLKGLTINVREGKTGLLSFGGHLYLSPELTLDRTRFQVQLNNIKLFERWVPIAMHGRLAATCEIEGPLLSPQAKIDISSKRLFALGFAWENFKTSLNCQYEKQALIGSVHLTSTGSGYHISSNADFQWLIGKTLRLPSLIFEGPRTKIKGSLLADLVNGGIESEIEGSTDDLTFMQELIEDTATGSLVFNSKFALTPEGKQTMDLSIKGDNLQVAALEAGYGEIEIHGQDLNSLPQANIKMKFHNFLWNTLHLDDAMVETTIDMAQDLWPFTFFGESKHILNQFVAKGAWHKDEESMLLAIDSASGAFLDEPLVLKEPITIRMSPELLNVSPLDIQFGPSKIFGKIDISRQNFEGAIHIQDVPLELVKKIDPSSPFSGRMDASLNLRGDPALPEGKIELTLEDLKIGEAMFAKLPALRGSIKAELKDNQLQASGDLDGLEEQPIHVEANLPVHVSFYPFTITFKPEEEIAAQLRIKGDVIPVLQLFLNDTNTLRGQTDIAIDVSGTYSSPQVSGKALIHNGTFESVKTGAVFKDINATFIAEGKEIRLTELSASDRFTGKITGTGLFTIDSSQSFPYHFDFNVQQTRFFNMDFADAMFTGTARLEGTTLEALLSGKFNADRLVGVIPEQLPAAAHSVDVTFVNTPKGNKVPSYTFKSKSEWPLKLDLAVAAPKNITISGTNLKTTWKGAINVQGTAESPELHGELKIDKGSYIFNGKEFVINQGTISFAGDVEKKTSLYIIASHDLGKIIAEIILRGPIKNPTISFRSNPPLSQREILAWILFGRGVSDISATEGAQLNQSITNLKSNNKGGTDMLTKIRNKMGIDRIDINRGDNEDANQVSVQVGKYISQGVYVSVNKSVTAESNQVCLEANLTREIKVQAEVGDDQEGQLLLKWKKDY